MSRATLTTTAVRPTPSPAPEVWRVLRRFGDLSWALGHGIASFEATGSGVGMRRTAIAPLDGGRIVEELPALDDADMLVEYTIVEGELPGLRDYVARAQVRPNGPASEIRWDCRATVEPDAERQGRALLDALAARMAALFAAQFET